MKIALCQMDIIWEDKKENYKKAEMFIKKAACKGVSLICFPEMSFTGFSMNINYTKDKNSETINLMKKYSQENQIAIGFGWVKENGNKGENHYTIVSKYGEIISDYIKIHPFSYSEEDLYFCSGEEVRKFNIDNINFSTFICYDLRFPEIFQSVSNEVSVIIVPANWPESRKEHWRCLLKARAIENMVYILGVNCVGEKNGIIYSGDSCIINPNGIVLEEVSYKEELMIYDLNDDVKEFRNLFPTKDDRKTELYKRLL